MTLTEIDGGTTEALIDRMFVPIIHNLSSKEKTTEWARSVCEKYNGFPQRTEGQKTEARKVVRSTAEQLLTNPQDIGAADIIWAREDGLFHVEVKQDLIKLMQEKWQDIKPEQLAELVRVRAYGLLKTYFDYPKKRWQRIHAYYIFMSSLVDLADDNEALKDGVEIAINRTDIVPIDPYLIEQGDFVSSPYTIFEKPKGKKKEKLLDLPRNKEEEKSLQKLIISKSILSKLVLASGIDLDEVTKEQKYLVKTNPNSAKMWQEQKSSSIERLGEERWGELYGGIRAFFNPKDNTPSPETKNPKTVVKWLDGLLHDPNDPLNQKFQKVFCKSVV